MTAPKSKRPVDDVLAQVEQLKRERETVEGYLSTLKTEDAAALLEVARRKGFPSVGGLAVSLLSEQLANLRSREQRKTTRRVLAAEPFARRWAQRIAEAAERAQAADWLAVDVKAATLQPHDTHPGSQKGLLVLDLRDRGELADTTGAITPDSVAAWLLGFTRPDPAVGK